MQKQNSKKKFLEKLYISLSFYFGDDDCDSIIKDYEEWFENEEMAEKSEYENMFRTSGNRLIIREKFIQRFKRRKRAYVSIEE